MGFDPRSYTMGCAMIGLPDNGSQTCEILLTRLTEIKHRTLKPTPFPSRPIYLTQAEPAHPPVHPAKPIALSDAQNPSPSAAVPLRRQLERQARSSLEQHQIALTVDCRQPRLLSPHRLLLQLTRSLAVSSAWRAYSAADCPVAHLPPALEMATRLSAPRGSP